jgi:hypothetical protein
MREEQENGTRRKTYETTLRLDEDRYERLREVAFRLRIPKQRALLEALDEWLLKQAQVKKPPGS